MYGGKVVLLLYMTTGFGFRDAISKICYVRVFSVASRFATEYFYSQLGL